MDAAGNAVASFAPARSMNSGTFDTGTEMSCFTLPNCASGTLSRIDQSAFASASFLAITAFGAALSASACSSLACRASAGQRIANLGAMLQHRVDAAARQQLERGQPVAAGVAQVGQQLHRALRIVHF